MQEGKLQRFVAIACTCKFAYAALHEKKSKMIAAGFLRNLIAVVPYQMYTSLTDNSIQFSHRKKAKHALVHVFDRLCWEHGIEHYLTKVTPPRAMAKSSA